MGCYIRPDAPQSYREVLLFSIGAFYELQECSYIATSARNATLTYIRNISRRKEILADEFDNSNVDDDHGSDPEFILLKSEEINSLAKIWDELDDKTKFLLSSRYILEKSYAEIANDLNVKPESARMALTRARRAALALSKKSHT